MRRSNENEAIEAMAAAWLAQRDEGLTPDEEIDFARWRAADRRHEAAAARLDRTWTSLQNLQGFRPAARAHPDRDLLACGAAGGARWIPRLGLALAGVAAVVATAVFFPRSEQKQEVVAIATSQTFTTTIDGFRRVNLPDGSVADLNGGSELRVRYAKDERRVTLIRGEAHFSVVKEPSRPFWVEAGAMTVRAVGTAFKVRLAEASVEVLVTEGRVEVDDTRIPEAIPQAVVDRIVHSVRAVLDAGERIRLPLDPVVDISTPLMVERLTPDDVRAELAWQDAWLVFRDTPLGQVVEQFNARNRVQLELGDAGLAALPIGGTFLGENVDGFVRLLVASGNVKVDNSAPECIVLRANR